MYIGPLKFDAPALPINIEWGTLWKSPYDLELTLERPAFVDHLTLSFGEQTLLKRVEVLGFPHACHAAETGKHITSTTLTLQVAEVCEKLTLRIQGDFSDISLQSIELYGAYEENAALFPTPNHVEWGEETFPAAQYPTLAADAPLKAAAVLAEKWQEETGLTLEKAEKAAIRFVNGACSANGYELKITAQEITLTAADERGFVCAAETLIKLLDQGQLPACSISDSPAHPMRGVHIYLPAPDQFDFTKRLFKYLISPMGYNMAIIEVAGGMQFDAHPLINQKVEEAIANGKAGIWPQFAHDALAGGKTLTKDQVRELVAYIRSFGIEVVPEIQSLGHVQYMTQAYPEIAELDELSEQLVDTRAEDTRPNKFYKHSFCPSNPRSYEILFDIIDEIVEVFQPKEYVHMGHDEVYEIGVCKRCRGKDPAQLLADDINKIYNYLQEKGLKMMIWADMLQNRKTGRLTHPANDRIPKDILLLDFIWYFHVEDDIEDYLLGKGFKVAVGNLYSSHYPRFNSRITKKGMVGGQISAWVGTDVNSMAQEGKLLDFRMTAQMLWSKHYTPDYQNVYLRHLLDATPALREKLEGITLPSLHGAGTEVEPSSIGRAGKSLLIRHVLETPVTKHPWVMGKKVGEYLLTYADGTTLRHPLFVGWNIDMPNHPYAPNAHKLYRHTGYAADYFCTPTTDGCFDMEILLEERTLASVELIPAENITVRVEKVTLFE